MVYHFTQVEVFSATKAEERSVMGEVITRWLSEHPDLEIVDREVRQSSDRAFHCLTIALFFRRRRSPEEDSVPQGE